jgi:hypothetical protein
VPIPEEEFKTAATMALRELEQWWSQYLEVCVENSRMPTVADFVHYIPYAQGFDHGTSAEAANSAGYIVALTEVFDQRTIREIRCPHCKAPEGMPCTNEGRPLDASFFHVARYNEACRIGEEADASS